MNIPNTVTKNKKILVEKDILEKRGNQFLFVDPVFRLWLEKEYLKM